MVGITTYPVKEVKDGTTNRKFFFVSTGESDVIKAVEYTRIRDFGIGGLYNLGFGDFDEESGTMDDGENSNNGDMRPVFATVLETIPKFFAENPYDTIVVQGSDSVDGFAQECRLTCENRRCGLNCKNVDRRITAYRYYVNKNYSTLKETYVFFGYSRALETLFPYQAEAKYDAVFVSKKTDLHLHRHEHSKDRA